MPTRIPATQATIFTVGGSAHIGNLINCTIEITNATQEGKGVADVHNYPVFVGRSYRLDGELFAAGSIVLMGTANSSNPVVGFTADTGHARYEGTAIISTISHRVEREGLQTYAITLDSLGSVTISQSS